MELAEKQGIPVEEKDIDLFDAYNADEMFLTSTSLCICPVSSIDGVEIGGGKVPGAGDQGADRCLCPVGRL